MRIKYNHQFRSWKFPSQIFLFFFFSCFCCCNYLVLLSPGTKVHPCYVIWSHTCFLNVAAAVRCCSVKGNVKRNRNVAHKFKWGIVKETRLLHPQRVYLFFFYALRTFMAAACLLVHSTCVVKHWTVQPESICEEGLLYTKVLRRESVQRWNVATVNGLTVAFDW